MLQPAPHIAIDRQCAGFLGFRLAGRQADHAAIKIDLLPPDAPESVLPGAGVIAAYKQRLEVGWQLLQQRLI